ncbi:hypothetical protein ACXOKK_10020, partial [Streptococcus thermophilus]
LVFFHRYLRSFPSDPYSNYYSDFIFADLFLKEKKLDFKRSPTLCLANFYKPRSVPPTAGRGWFQQPSIST